MRTSPKKTLGQTDKLPEGIVGKEKPSVGTCTVTDLLYSTYIIIGSYTYCNNRPQP